MGCRTEPVVVHIAHVLQKLHFFQFFIYHTNLPLKKLHAFTAKKFTRLDNFFVHESRLQFTLVQGGVIGTMSGLMAMPRAGTMAGSSSSFVTCIPSPRNKKETTVHTRYCQPANSAYLEPPKLLSPPQCTGWPAHRQQVSGSRQPKVSGSDWQHWSLARKSLGPFGLFWLCTQEMDFLHCLNTKGGRGHTIHAERGTYKPYKSAHGIGGIVSTLPVTQLVLIVCTHMRCPEPKPPLF